MKQRKIIAIMLAVIVALVPFTPVAAQTTPMPARELMELKQVIADKYVDDIKVEDLTGDTPEEVFQHLDQHSAYYSPTAFSSLLDRLYGEYAGIGAYVQEIDGKVIIAEPIEGSPSFRAGLKPGDEIIYVDGKTVEGMTAQEVGDLIRGPVGTRVTVDIKRKGTEETLRFTLVREYITIKTVSYEIMGDVGYIEIRQFTENTYQHTVEAMAQLLDKNIDKLIIDVRDNPGGMLNSVIDISRLLVKRGPILHIDYKDYTVQYMSYLTKPHFNNVVVLVNEGSASASEVLAAAIQDSDAGIIVGKTTYGKGSVQRIRPFYNYGGFKLTEARYLSPNKKVIDGVGVKPDYEVERFPDIFDIGNLVSRDITRDINKRARGPEVLGIQQRLQGLGYTIKDSRGVFGDGTMEALKTFAKDHNLQEPTLLTAELQREIYKAFYNEVISTEYDQQLNFALKYLEKLDEKKTAK